MSSLLCPRLGLWLLASCCVLLVVCAASPSGVAAAGSFTPPPQIFPLPASSDFTGLVGNATSLNIAVLMMCANSSTGGIQAPRVRADYFYEMEGGDITHSTEAYLSTLEMLLTPEQIHGQHCHTGLNLYHDYYLSFLLFQSRVNAQCNGGVDPSTAAPGMCGIPTSRFNSAGVQLRAPLNLIYFNLGPLPIPGTPDAAFAEQTYTNAGLLASLLTTAFPQGYLLGHFPFVFPPAYGGEYTMSIFSDACEATKTCVAVNAYQSSDEILKCIVQPIVGTNPPISACPTLCTTLKGGCRAQRRYDFSVSYLFDQSNLLSNLNTQMRQRGARTYAVLASGLPAAQSTMAAAFGDMSEKGISVVWQRNTGYDLAAGKFLPALTEETCVPWAEEIIASNPDVVVFAADTQETEDMETFANIIVHFKKANWMPKAIVGGAGSYTVLAAMVGRKTGNPLDGGYVSGSNINDLRLRTRGFKTIASPADPRAMLNITNPNINWEPYPTNLATGEYGGMELAKAYIQAFGDTTPLSMLQGYIIPQVSSTTLSMATKLFELAGTDDPIALQAASYRISAPSVGGLIQFDPLGRLVAQDQPVVQVAQDGLTLNLITPVDVATATDVYPMPSWEERQYHDQELSQPKEKVVVAINTLCIAFLAFLALAITLFRTSAVIKAASPGFCVLTLFGAIVCLCSNYATSLHPSTGSCAANVWLLTTGFTVMFSSLLAKTWRLIKIFQSGKLSVVKISNMSLVGIVVGSAMVDVLLNAIWSGAAPFGTEVVTVDPIRPAYDYTQCDYTRTATNMMYTQIAWKSTLVLAAIVLTIRARNLPSSFNESLTLSASIYNTAVLLLFLVPILGTGVGSRDTTYLLRNYGVMVLVVSSMCILFLPKLALVYSLKSSAVGVTTAVGAHTVLGAGAQKTVGSDPAAGGAAAAASGGAASPFARNNPKLALSTYESTLGGVENNLSNGGGDKTPAAKSTSGSREDVALRINPTTSAAGAAARYAVSSPTVEATSPSNRNSDNSNYNNNNNSKEVQSLRAQMARLQAELDATRAQLQQQQQANGRLVSPLLPGATTEEEGVETTNA